MSPDPADCPAGNLPGVGGMSQRVTFLRKQAWRRPGWANYLPMATALTGSRYKPFLYVCSLYRSDDSTTTATKVAPMAFVRQHCITQSARPSAA